MKIKCILRCEDFKIELDEFGVKTLFKCPICNNYFRVSYPLIGLSNNCSVVIDNGEWHEIIGEEAKQ